MRLHFCLLIACGSSTVYETKGYGTPFSSFAVVPGGRVYAVDGLNFIAATDGGKVLGRAGDFVQMFAADEERLFWREQDSPVIEVLTIASGARSTLPVQQENCLLMAMERETLLLTCGSRNSALAIVRAPKNGAMPTVVANEAGGQHAVVDNGYAYFIGGRAVKRLALATGAIEVVFDASGSLPTSDSLNDYLSDVAPSSEGTLFVQNKLGAGSQTVVHLATPSGFKPAVATFPGAGIWTAATKGKIFVSSQDQEGIFAVDAGGNVTQLLSTEDYLSELLVADGVLYYQQSDGKRDMRQIRALRI